LNTLNLDENSMLNESIKIIIINIHSYPQTSRAIMPLGVYIHN
jgi:hypothetical protein